MFVKFPRNSVIHGNRCFSRAAFFGTQFSSKNCPQSSIACKAFCSASCSCGWLFPKGQALAISSSWFLYDMTTKIKELQKGTWLILDLEPWSDIRKVWVFLMVFLDNVGTNTLAPKKKWHKSPCLGDIQHYIPGSSKYDVYSPQNSINICLVVFFFLVKKTGLCWRSR